MMGRRRRRRRRRRWRRRPRMQYILRDECWRRRERGEARRSRWRGWRRREEAASTSGGGLRAAGVPPEGSRQPGARSDERDALRHHAAALRLLRRIAAAPSATPRIHRGAFLSSPAAAGAAGTHSVVAARLKLGWVAAALPLWRRWWSRFVLESSAVALGGARRHRGAAGGGRSAGLRRAEPGAAWHWPGGLLRFRCCSACCSQGYAQPAGEAGRGPAQFSPDPMPDFNSRSTEESCRLGALHLLCPPAPEKPLHAVHTFRVYGAMASVTPPLGGPPTPLSARVPSTTMPQPPPSPQSARATRTYHTPPSADQRRRAGLDRRRRARRCSCSCRRGGRRRRRRRDRGSRPPCTLSSGGGPTALSSGGGTVASTAAASAAAAATVGATAPLQPALTPRRNLWHSKVTSMQGGGGAAPAAGRELRRRPTPSCDSPSPHRRHARPRRPPRLEVAGRRPPPLHRPSLLASSAPRVAAGTAATPSAAFDSSLLEERCRRCLAAAVPPSAVAPSRRPGRRSEPGRGPRATRESVLSGLVQKSLCRFDGGRDSAGSRPGPQRFVRSVLHSQNFSAIPQLLAHRCRSLAAPTSSAPARNSSARSSTTSRSATPARSSRTRSTSSPPR